MSRRRAATVSPSRMAPRAARRAGTSVRWPLVLALALACGGPRRGVDDALDARDLGGALDAYDRFRTTEGADVELLGDVAGLLLELEALSDDPARRDAALIQLELAGNAGLPALRRIGRSEGITLARARALEALVKRRDSEARAFLYALLDVDDPAILAEAVAALQNDEEARMLTLAAHASPEVRRAAALRLAARRDSVAALDALVGLARVDPEPRVREAACRALGSFGAAAVERLRERLGDPDPSVRQTVVRALVQADRGAAIPIITPLLGLPPSPASIEAARVLAYVGPEEIRDETGETALQWLISVLSHPDANLRSTAAIALVSVAPTGAPLAALREALSREEDRGVRLGLARALLPSDDDDTHPARDALHDLIEERDMPGVQAAALLAERDDAAGVAALEATLGSEEALLRGVAARALARGAHLPDAVLPALRDPEPSVRIQAAGGVLAASN
ncbi:MAG: HEAT repeat domain-containing protein [Sandaracinus sp.]|nr:HEAT repeat domain-containing protein [Sandaracinus sp.]